MTNYTRVDTDNKGGHNTRENRAIVRVVECQRSHKKRKKHFLVWIIITTKGLDS